jgi:hypothetical protein
MILRMRSAYASCLVFSIILSQSLWAANQTTWRWLDSDGKVTYGDHPPNGTEATRIHISTGTSSSEPAPNNDLAGGDQTTGSKASAKDPTSTSQLAMNPEKSKALCLQARTNLEILKDHAMIRQVDESGETRMLSEEEKQAQIKTAQTIIESYCP